MLGQTTFGWVDRCCRQATGLLEKLFGGKSIILLGDSVQLPPVGDKPLYYSKPPNTIAEEGFYAYRMFDNVVILKINQRAVGSKPDQILFREMLFRLRNGDSSVDDWKV